MSTPSDADIREMVKQFMGRVQLTGQEVPAFNHVMRWLESTLEEE